MATFPVRLRRGLKHVTREARLVYRWLRDSNEHTNYSYDLDPVNMEHLAWWLANLLGIDVDRIRAYLDEIAQDQQLIAALRTAARLSPRHRILDAEPRYARRLGWYVIVRATQPDHIVETGTDRGLGSCIIAAALLRNGSGRLTTIDVNDEAGSLIASPYSEVIDQRTGDSVAILREPELPSVDVFIHDSLHTEEHEQAELSAVATKLSSNSYVLSDNAHQSLALSRWAEATGRAFSFFREEPHRHWHPGGGIGIAVSSPRKHDSSTAPSMLEQAD